MPVFYKTAKLEHISKGTLGHHLLYDQGISLLITFKNSHVEMQPTKKTPNTLHGC